MIDEKEVTLQFQAPRQPGIYKYKLVIRSDSYLDCDRVQQLNVYVVPSTMLGTQMAAEEEWGQISSEGSDDENAGDGNLSDSSYSLFFYKKFTEVDKILKNKYFQNRFYLSESDED